MRIENAFKIVSSLQRQKKLINQEDASSKDAEEKFQENFKYSLQRFVSALASDRMASRKGYFVGLVQLLKMFPEEAKVCETLERINTQLSIGKGSKSVSLSKQSLKSSKKSLKVYKKSESQQKSLKVYKSL